LVQPTAVRRDPAGDARKFIPVQAAKVNKITANAFATVSQARETPHEKRILFADPVFEADQPPPAY
jgi:hypothetical protein